MREILSEYAEAVIIVGRADTDKSMKPFTSLCRLIYSSVLLAVQDLAALDSDT
jgi:hypothetical protein